MSKIHEVKCVPPNYRAIIEHRRLYKDIPDRAEVSARRPHYRRCH